MANAKTNTKSKAKSSTKTSAKPAIKKTTNKSVKVAAKQTTKVKAEETKKCSKNCAKNSSGAKKIFICMLILAIIAVLVFLCMGLTGCFHSKSIAGDYELTYIEENGEDKSDSISVMKDLGLKGELNLREDKTGTLVMFNESQDEFTYDDEKFYKNNDQGELEYYQEDDKIIIKNSDNLKLIFEKKVKE